MYTCIIVDDQEESVNLIKDHVGNIPRLELLYATTNPVEALAFLDSERPDIVFIDIEMPEINGMDVTETLREKWGNNMPCMVFVTGYNEYALNGFDLGVSDYLLKPVTFKRFKKAVDRIVHGLDNQERKGENTGFLFVDGEYEKTRLNFADIIYIEGAGNYIHVVTREKRYILYKSVKSMIDILPPADFIRVHKSYLVSVDKIIALGDSKLTLNINNKEVKLPIGNTYKKEVFKRLNIY
jgi:two-component system, LytTR family, response regulator